MKLEELTGLTPEQKIKALIIYDAYGYEKADTNSIDIKSAEELEDLYDELKDGDDFGSSMYDANKPYLFTQTDRRITQTDRESCFDDPDYIEYQLKETKSYSLEKVKPIKTIATLGIDLNVEVTFNGEKISLKELKELLNKE